MGRGETRTGSILTPGQREFLRGERDDIDPDGSHSRMIKSRIRDRLREGMNDLDLILRRLNPDDIQKALELRESPTDRRIADLEVETGLSSVIGVVYLACLDREESTFWLGDHPEGRTFKKRGESGIRDALNRLDISVEDVNLTVEIKRGEEFNTLADLDPAELAAYSMTELQQAHLNSAITDEQFFGAMKEQGRFMDRDDE